MKTGFGTTDGEWEPWLGSEYMRVGFRDKTSKSSLIAESQQEESKTEKSRNSISMLFRDLEIYKEICKRVETGYLQVWLLGLYVSNMVATSHLWLWNP